MLTVAELRKLIKDLPDDTILVMQGDSEGNFYRGLNGVDFVIEGDKANYFDSEEDEVYRGEDLQHYDRDPEDVDLQLCAVLF